MLWTGQPHFVAFPDLIPLTSFLLSVCSFSGGSTLTTRICASPPVPLLSTELSPLEPAFMSSEISTQVSTPRWFCWSCCWRFHGALCHLCRFCGSGTNYDYVREFKRSTGTWHHTKPLLPSDLRRTGCAALRIANCKLFRLQLQQGLFRIRVHSP